MGKEVATRDELAALVGEVSRVGQRLGSDLAPPWGGGLDSVSLLIEEYQTGGKSQYESIKKVGQKKDLPGHGYTSIRCP